MNLIADILMVAGTFGVAIYCYVLSVRLRRFAMLETGMGGAIAVLSAQVDDMTKALEQAQSTAKSSASVLEGLTVRAETSAARLEVLLASMHDLPDQRGRRSSSAPQVRRVRVRRRADHDEWEMAQ